MKQFFVWVLCVAIILSMAACVGSKDSVSASESYQKEAREYGNEMLSRMETGRVPSSMTQQQESKPVEPMGCQPLPVNYTLEDLVADYLDTELKWIDEFGNEWEIDFEIPQIYPFSNDVIAAQDEILEKCLPMYEEAQEALKKGWSVGFNRFEYESWIAGEVLTILLIEDTNFDMTIYDVYSFDLVTGARLDNISLTDKFGLAWEDCRDAAAKAAGEYFVSCYSELPEEFRDSFYESQYVKTISDQNIENAQLFITQESKLMMAVDIYALAGADSYPHIVEIPVWFYK